MTEEAKEAIYNGAPQHGLAIFPSSLMAGLQMQVAMVEASQRLVQAGLRLNPFWALFVR